MNSLDSGGGVEQSFQLVGVSWCTFLELAADLTSTLGMRDKHCL